MPWIKVVWSAFIVVVAGVWVFSIGPIIGPLLLNWWFREELQWSEELRVDFNGFYDMFSRKANENMTVAERIHRDYMLEIERTFRRNGICHHLEYISNSDEAVKKRIADDDVEFDVMMVIDRHEYDLQVFHDNDRPGYAWLKQFRGEKPSPELRNVLSYWNFWEFISAIFFNVDLYVDPDRTVHALINELRNITQNSVRLKGTLKFSQRGPVIQMDVHPDSWFIFWGPLLYSVDLVPAYQVDGTVFVSTPLKGETPNAMTWRRSFSIHDEDSVCEDVGEKWHP